MPNGLLKFDAAACRKKCPGGNACCCRTMDGSRRLRHELHICHDATCPCHSAARYAALHAQRDDTTHAPCNAGALVGVR